jgi:hypothetical protein
MVAQVVRRMSHTGHKDNEHGVPTYWGKSGSTLQKYITALATTDFLLFGFDVRNKLACLSTQMNNEN